MEEMRGKLKMAKVLLSQRKRQEKTSDVSYHENKKGASLPSRVWGNIEPVLGESGGAPAMSQLTVTAPRELLETLQLHVCQGWRVTKYKREATLAFVKKVCSTVPPGLESTVSKLEGKLKAEQAKTSQLEVKHHAELTAEKAKSSKLTATIDSSVKSKKEDVSKVTGELDAEKAKSDQLQKSLEAEKAKSSKLEAEKLKSAQVEKTLAAEIEELQKALAAQAAKAAKPTQAQCGCG